MSPFSELYGTDGSGGGEVVPRGVQAAFLMWFIPIEDDVGFPGIGLLDMTGHGLEMWRFPVNF